MSETCLFESLDLRTIARRFDTLFRILRLTFQSPEIRSQRKKCDILDTGAFIFFFRVRVIS